MSFKFKLQEILTNCSRSYKQIYCGRDQSLGNGIYGCQHCLDTIPGTWWEFQLDRCRGELVSLQSTKKNKTGEISKWSAEKKGIKVGNDVDYYLCYQIFWKTPHLMTFLLLGKILISQNCYKTITWIQCVFGRADNGKCGECIYLFFKLN